MKRTITSLLLVMLLMTAFGGIRAAAAEETFMPDGSVLFDRDGVTVTTAGLDFDPTANGEPIIWLEIENNGPEGTYLGVTNGAVNRFMRDAYLVTFYEEDGEYYGGDYSFGVTLPAGAGGRYALAYNWVEFPGVPTDRYGEMSLCFAVAEDEFTTYDYISEPVTILTGGDTEPVDIDALGTVVLDDDSLKLVIGEQDYDFGGPMIYVYAENRTDHYIGLGVSTAEADGLECDYVYFYVPAAPGLCGASILSFDSPIREMKGFESLTLHFFLCEADSMQGLNTAEETALDPITVAYGPQNWGEYENGGLHLDIQPRYNDLITVETPEDDENGILITVSETASLEAGDYDGAGWLFSIGRMDADRLHEMLCWDMSGAEVFAVDSDDNYYMYYHPTDVRYERATLEEMRQDQDQWMTLCEWAESVPYLLIDLNPDLEYFSRTNTAIDMALARAAYDTDARYTLSTAEFGPLVGADFDAAPYAEALMNGGFYMTDLDEAPEGEYVVLAFPEEDVRFDFFTADGTLVREVRDSYEFYYGAIFYDDTMCPTDIVQGWYDALAVRDGLKEPDTGLDAYVGTWAEQIAGRGVLEIEKSLAPGKVKIEARWPSSAAVESTWEVTAALDEDGRLVYDNGVFTTLEYGEDGEGWIIDERWDASGVFELRDNGELVWHDELSENDEDSVFLLAE